MPQPLEKMFFNIKKKNSNLYFYPDSGLGLLPSSSPCPVTCGVFLLFYKQEPAFMLGISARLWAEDSGNKNNLPLPPGLSG